MKRFILGAASLLMAFSANAQDLPQNSPIGEFSQRIGLTDVSAKYSRPSMKGRTIFGELVPYNEMWRTGANANTTITFSTAVNIGGKNLAGGTYSLFVIPTEDEWTLVFNTKTDHWGTGGYSEENDALRITAKTSAVASTESFTIAVNDLVKNSGNLVLSWDKTSASVPVKVQVAQMAQSNIEKAIETGKDEELWRVYRNSASYYYNNKIELEQALEYMKLSINKKEDSWYSYWLKAEIEAELKMYKDARKTAKVAFDMGTEAAVAKETEFGYGPMISEAIEKWKGMK